MRYPRAAPSMNDDDRRILLRRRALFVSAALAATACGGSKPAPKPQPGAVEVTPVASNAPTESGTAPERNPAPDLAAPPEIVIPADASEDALRMYAHLKKQVARTQVDVAGVARSMLTCNVDDCRSDAAVERLARAHAAALQTVGALEPLCPGSSEHGHRYAEVVREQQAFFEAKLKSYTSELHKRMHAVSDFAERFRAASLRANAAQPRACLDCADW
ncbi:MAG TPA: hypothetical protein PKD61_19705 [Polyangiaceae bacterium]|nr:hypothetical protein [Polyangiaceae bacterium]